MLGTLDFTVSELWAPFNFSWSPILISPNKCLSAYLKGGGTLIGGRVLNWRGRWVFSCTDSVIDSKGGTNWKSWPWGWVLIWRKALIRTWVLIWRNTVSSEVKFYKGRVHTYLSQCISQGVTKAWKSYFVFQFVSFH